MSNTSVHPPTMSHTGKAVRSHPRWPDVDSAAGSIGGIRIRAALVLLLTAMVVRQVKAQQPAEPGGERVGCHDLQLLTSAAEKDSALRRRTGSPGSSADSSGHYQPQTFESFVVRTVGPLALTRATALAGFDQWRHQPVHWNQDGRGFRDRLDSRLGAEVLSRTIRFGVARAAHEQTIKYRPCACEGVGTRLVYALESPLRVETPSGLRLSAITPLTEMGSAVVITSVHPGGLSLKDGLLAGLSSVASRSLTGVVREFWPWRWRPPGMD